MIINDFLSILSFLTVIPVSKNVTFDEKRLPLGIIYFPIVGSIIGLLNFILCFGLKNITQGYLLIILLMLFEIFLSGGLHVDGLADTFDAIASSRNKEKMLEIMKDSRIGTFGVLSIVFDIILKLLLLYELKSDLSSYILVLPIASRGLASVYMYETNYPKNSTGIGSFFIGKISFFSFAITIIATSTLVYMILGTNGVIILLFTFICSQLYKTYIIGKINCITGDVIGSGIQISETIFLLGGVILNWLQQTYF